MIRIRIGKRFEGRSQIMLRPPRGQPYPPVLLADVTRENLKERVSKAYAEMVALPRGQSPHPWPTAD